VDQAPKKGALEVRSSAVAVVAQHCLSVENESYPCEQLHLKNCQ